MSVSPATLEIWQRDIADFKTDPVLGMGLMERRLLRAIDEIVEQRHSMDSMGRTIIALEAELVTERQRNKEGA